MKHARAKSVRAALAEISALNAVITARSALGPALASAATAIAFSLSNQTSS